MDIAVVARLFGRVQLLTIDATVDINGTPNGDSNGVPAELGEQGSAASNAERSDVRRSTVEELLNDASEVLDSSRF